MAVKRRTAAAGSDPAAELLKKQKAEKAEREAFMNGIRVGHRDINNNLITQVHMKDDKFVIYEVDVPILTDTLKTIVYTLDTVPAERQVVVSMDKIAMCMSDAEDVMSKATDKQVFKGRMASAIGHALLGNVTEGQEMFRKLIEQTNIEYSQQLTDRAYYRGTALIASLLMVSLALYASESNIFVPLLTKLIYIAAGGSIGGFLSISLSIRNMVFEKGLDRKDVIVYAAERLIFSIFAACIVAVAVRLNLVFGFLNTLNAKSPNIYEEGYVIAAVIAGFSETFLPNLLVKLEKKS